jgi:hypothetical protein
VSITAISGNTVTITPTLAYTHFGDTNATIQNNYGTLDMRAGVGHLTRNIKIVRGADADGWGFRVLTYGFIDGNITRIGTTNLHGVEFIEGGQTDTDYAAVSFKSTTGNPYTSLVDSCSFVNSGAYSVRL